MERKLQELLQNCLNAIENCGDLNNLKEIEIKYLGRKGELTDVLRGVKNLNAEEKPIIGKLANDIKVKLEETFEIKRQKLEASGLEDLLKKDPIDLTEPGRKPDIGTFHPITIVQKEVEYIFSQMGFSIMDGPEIESEAYNFEHLNIPGHHPARDMQDTFFIDKEADKEEGRLVLRTHTSPVQVRTMRKYGAPLRVIVPGRVFRNEATDARHEHTFDQVEGFLIDKDISLAHLKGVMKEFLTRLFKKDVTVRFRPGYFPFVEPGIELDFSCLLCNAKGCRVCKNTGWLEFMGAGMIHEHVLKAGKVDTSIYQGWAFGFGLTRLVMMRYEIDDIRYLMNPDLRFLRQF